MKHPNNIDIAIITGGTGGHIFPGRATALALTKAGDKVTIIGDKNYSKYHQKTDPFDYKIINCSQVNRGFTALIKSGYKISLGILQSLFLLLASRAQVVIAFGGYATFPALIAAVILRKKIILHEQNAHLGKVNRLFARFAQIIALSYSETSGIDDRYQSKTKFIGNPVREEIIALSNNEYTLPNLHEKKPIIRNNLGYNLILASDFEKRNNEALPLGSFNILVIGGSGGAKIFSENLPKVFFNIREELKNHLVITQQCRKEDIDSVFNQYKSFNLNFRVKSFFDDMDKRIKNAHLIIARAGSSSIAEITAAKRPAILIPFALAADNHQEKNALFIEKMGGAVVVREKNLNISKVTSLIEKLIDNPELLMRMSRLSAASAKLDATDNLVRLIHEKLL